jgi:hypothetical protein
MKQVMLILAGLALVGSQIACCQITLPRVPDVEINVPTVEVGEMQDRQEAIPLGDTRSATVEILFGAGELTLAAGTSDQLLSGHFRYNVERWAPEIAFEDGTLTIEQGSTRQDWGFPTGNVHNEWDLEFSPHIPLTMDLEVGAGDGELDFSGLQLEELGLKLGAGDYEVRFDEPNEAAMGQFTLDAGASKLEVTGIGYAGPQQMRVQGGVGDITLDFTGTWPRSSDVQVTAGVGSVTLRLPDDVGVRVETKGGLTSVEVSGLQRSGDAYVNDVFGETETELRIHITTGIGSVRLIEVSND